jgi:hypothetical protein
MSESEFRFFDLEYKVHLDENNNLLGFNYDNFWMMGGRGVCKIPLEKISDVLGDDVISVSPIEKLAQGKSLDFFRLSPLVRGTLYQYSVSDELLVYSLEEEYTKGFLEETISKLKFLTYPLDIDFRKRCNDWFRQASKSYLDFKMSAQLLDRDGDEIFGVLQYAVFLGKTGKTREEAFSEAYNLLGVKPFEGKLPGFKLSLFSESFKSTDN